MKKNFDILKSIFADNKEYFIKCTIMSLIAALILGLSITLAIPASAVGEPAEGDRAVISAGIYRFNDVLSAPIVGGNGYGDLSGGLLGFSVSTLVDGTDYTFDCIGLVPGVDIDGTYLSYFVDMETELRVYDDEDGGWYIDSFGEGVKTISVTDSTDVTPEIYDWFIDNTVRLDSFVIEAGYYRSKESMNGRYFDASDDSIDLRYYDPFDSVYVDTEGMIFTIENDMALIFYGADEVFLDGWHMDQFQSIEILTDAVVDPQFYYCFFGLYSSSDADSNIYNIGFADGYLEGRDKGYSEGYNQGYHQGLADNIGSSDTFLGSIIENVLDALDNLVIVGDFSILDILKTIIGAFVVIFFLKLIAGG